MTMSEEETDMMRDALDETHELRDLLVRLLGELLGLYGAGHKSGGRSALFCQESRRKSSSHIGT